MISTCHVRTPILLLEENTDSFWAFWLACAWITSSICRITLEQSVIIAPCLPQVLQIGHIARWQVQYDLELAIVLGEPRF